MAERPSTLPELLVETHSSLNEAIWALTIDYQGEMTAVLRGAIAKVEDAAVLVYNALALVDSGVADDLANEAT